ncbi:recombinase family protein [Rhodoferax sp.]|uniref:recombinase family protein n=1 Tax=Rhodoferax sp. TaxID=50421 RepID=UPI00262F5C19|nr:recombinase family protein [Rhodoferax sp.]MDD2917812.1 recombinase family protein [Rhodoferax sp.]
MATTSKRTSTATPKLAPAGQAVGYVRVSSAGQNDARQLDGVTLDKTFTDKASGKDTQRPQLQSMLEFVREGDCVYVHSMDRLARSLSDLETIVKGLTGRGVAVTFTTQAMTFTGDDSPMNTLMLQLLGAVGQFERALIRERQREGIAIAKAKGGVYTGRKPSLDAAGVIELRTLVAQGIPKARIAERLGISRTTLYAALATPANG